MRALLLLVLAGALLGAAVGALRASAAGGEYRAQATLAVGQGVALFPTDPKEHAARPVTETLAELVRSRVVAENVIANLRLQDVTADELLGRTDVRTKDGANLVTIVVDDSDAKRAAQIAQETALVFSQLVKERFGNVTAQPTGQLPLTATIFDPAQTGREVRGDPARDGAFGSALGAAVGLLVGGLLLTRRRAPAPELPEGLDVSHAHDSRERELAALRAELATARNAVADAERELASARIAPEEEVAPDERLEEARAEAARLRGELAQTRREAETRLRDDDEAFARRTEAITARELKAARTHAELVARGRALDVRESALTEREQGLARDAERASAAVSLPAEPAHETPDLTPASAPDPAPSPQTDRLPAGGPAAAVTLVDLERLVEAHRADYPDRAEDWAFYLVYLREHADASGSLPASFDWLLDDVFGDLLAARSA